MRKLLFLASIIVLVDTSFYAAITPLLPELTEEFGLSKTGAGMLAAAFPLGTFAGGLPGGVMAARFGVKFTVLFGLVLMTFASVAIAFAHSIVLLDLARFLQGFGSAAGWAGAMAWVAGAAPREKRGQMLGSVMGAAIAGALLGPVIGVARRPGGLRARVLRRRRHRHRADRVDAAGPRASSRSATARCAGLGRLAAQPRGPHRPAAGDRPRPAVRHDVACSARSSSTSSAPRPPRSAPSGCSPPASRRIVSPIAGRMSDRRGRLAPLLAGLVGGAVTFAILPVAEHRARRSRW